MASDEEIAGDVPDDAVVDPPHAPAFRPRRPRAIREQGPWRVFLILACAPGLWHETFKGHVDQDCSPEAGSCLIVGLVVAKWSWWAAEKPLENDAHRSAFVQRLLARSKAREVRGFIDYPIEAAAKLEVPIACAFRDPQAMLQLIHGLRVTRLINGARFVTGTVQEYMALFREHRNGPAGVTPVWLSPCLACKVVSGMAASLHMLAVSRRLRRSGLLLRSEPSRKVLKQLCDRYPLVAIGRHALAVGARCHKLMYEPEVVLEWLEATSHIKDSQKIHSAMGSFGKIFARRLQMPLHSVLEGLPTISYETLRRARVRLDCVAMALHRRLAHAILEHDAHVYIWCDASPQWRGLELFAATIEIFDGSGFHRRLAPLLSLEHSQLDASGKMLALLYQCWLMVGPRFGDLRRFCDRIRGICTDMGTERLLANMPDVVPDFMKLIHPKFLDRVGHVGGDFAFPRALQIPGWLHLWDVVLRRGLASLRFFPKWMADMQQLMSFLRSEVVIAQLCKDLVVLGLPGIAEMLQALKLPTIATWRWKTLGEACRALEPVLETLCHHFDPAPFLRNARDPARMRGVVSALTSQHWPARFKFVTWFCNWIGRIMDWIGGCDCCEHSPSSKCPWKGRRMKNAHSFAHGALHQGLAEANSWTHRTWQTTMEEWTELVGCVRAVVHLGMAKIGFFRRIPYLLVELDRPGIRDECIRQYESCPEDKHHRVSREFLKVGGPLRASVDALRADGSGCTEQLRMELKGLEALPMDDSIGEGPHAKAKRIKDHSKASTWHWTAATMRLKQNLDDVAELVPALDENLTLLWCKYQSILQVEARKLRRSVKVSRKVFADRLYRMSVCFDDIPEVFDGGHDQDEAPDDLWQPGGAPQAVEDDAMDDVPEPGVVVAVVAVPHPRKDPMVMLLRQYLAAALQTTMFVSMPVLVEDATRIMSPTPSHPHSIHRSIRPPRSHPQ